MARPGPCGMGCGNVASGVFVWSWGEGIHRTERIICDQCTGKDRPRFPPVLDATPLSRAAEDAADAELDAVLKAMNPDLQRLARENGPAHDTEQEPT